MRNNVLNVKARGRQRCKLVPGAEVRTLAGRLKQITVKMLAEPPVSTPLCDTQLFALKQKRPFIPSFCDDRPTSFNKYRRYHLSQYPFASWVYNQYEVNYYIKRITEKLANFGGNIFTDIILKVKC